ncbi:MAG: hypothetical protein EPO06_12005 [Burkholderiaceae bacterium]|nr:MAG: hypothetical protein EPO06_12005 [Burkholderiaceae bacterium]
MKTRIVHATKKWLSSRAAIALAQFVALAALILSVFIGVQWRNFVNCLANYNDQYAAVTATRAAAADRDRAAEDAMWQAFQDAGNPAKVPPAQARQYAREAFDRYLAARQQARDDRARNPLPSPPKQACR